jgi:DNA-binding transcriptional MerR regulator
MRIGALAAAVGTTPRTIRYYEEIGLLAPSSRPVGAHREYLESDVERLREILRLKALLGLSLDELREVVALEDARARRRRAWAEAPDPRLLDEASAHVDRLLQLVSRRREELAAFESELHSRRQAILAARER